MSGTVESGCRLVFVADALAGTVLIDDLCAGAPRRLFGREDLIVAHPWQGRLFAEIGALAETCRTTGDGEGGTAVLGLVVPVVWCGGGPAPDLVLVTDHVNLRLKGPLTGRRPVSGPQPFPSLTGIYQPALLRPRVAARVYSETAVAGVADAGALTPFETRELARSGCSAVSDCLVDAVIVAALHGLRVAACGVPQHAAD